MKEKQIHIRADEEFLQKLEYLMGIYGFKSLSDTIRKIVEKEYRKEKEK
jgi:metal-responsive CopG/Arc/MetJ family transcriptional regulator